MATPTQQTLWVHLVRVAARMRLPGWAVSLALAVLVLAVPAAQAASKVWNNAAGGNWSTGTNWTPNGAPAAGDDVDITLAGSYTVTLDVSTSIGTLQLGGASGTQTLAAAGFTLDITAAGASNVNANGAIDFSASAINRSGGAFTNNGTVTFSGGALNVNNGAFANGGVLRKTGAGTTNVSLTSATFTNTALVDAVAGTLLFVDGGAGSVASSGPGNTFTAAPGATITHGVPANAFAGTTFSGAGAQSINASGQTFVLSGTITAQNLNMALGTFVPNGATLAGTYAWNGPTIGAGTGLTIAPGAVVNVDVDSTVSCCGASLVQNFGTVNINGPGVRTFSLASAPGFWNQTGGVFNVNTHVILNLSAGSEFRNAGTVNLAGDVDAVGIAGLVQVTNSGTFNLNNNLLFLNSTGTNTYTQTAGTTDLGSSTGAISIPSPYPINVSGGSVIGRGLLGGTVTLGAGATIAPGQSPGIIRIGGHYNQNGGTYAVEVNGTTPGTNHDQLEVEGNVALNGPLTVALGFVPTVGTVFTIISNTEGTPSAVPDGRAPRRGGSKSMAPRSNNPVTGTFTGLAEGATFSVGGTNLQVSYVGGDGNDVTLTVVTGAAVATTTTVTGAPNPSVFGQSVTLTATVTGSSPTGTVQFRDGATNLGAPVALAGGQAQLVTSALAVGAHSITAVYGGDSGNQGSTSPVFTQTVNAAATTTAIVSALPGTLAPGQSVTVNVIVAAVAPGAGTPTGTVDVTDGGSPLCTVTLSGGSGACAAALNTLGTHPLTASYLATTSHNASSSAPTDVTVAAAPPVTSLATPIPTLRDWVLAALSLLLATFAANRLRRR